MKPSKQLETSSSAIFRLSDTQARAVQHAIKCSSEFIEVGRASGWGSGIQAKDMGHRDVIKHLHRQATFAHWSEKSQLRLERVGSPWSTHNLSRWFGAWCMCMGSRQDEDASERAPSLFEAELLDALDRAWDILAAVADAHLPAHVLPLLPHSTGLESPAESVVDAFFYPRHPLQTITCASHQDPGLITVIAENSPGLEVCIGDSEWIPIKLGPTDVAVIVGRTWAKFESYGPNCQAFPGACTHRVRSKSDGTRCSVTFEVRASQEGQLMLAQAQAQALSSVEVGDFARYDLPTHSRSQ